MIGPAVTRVFRAVFLVSALFFLPVQTATLAAEDSPAMAGRVRDSIGNVLEGVELLVVAPSSSRVPLAVATSDLLGRFAVARLNPGSYRIAAIKSGYLTAIGQIDTRLEKWVELVLHPMPEAGEATGMPLPRDGSWALRLPRRSIFRETEQGVAGASDAEPEPESAEYESLNMQVDHQFAYHAPPAEDDARPGYLQGSTTRLRVASAIGERGSLRLAGSHGTLDGTLDSGVDDSPGVRSASSEDFRFDFSYDASAADQFAVEGFFREEGLAGAGLQRSRRTWGYKSGWSRQLAPASIMAVEVDIQDRTGMPDTDFSNRTMGAGGSYRSVTGQGHELEVGFRARMVETPIGFDYRPSGSTFATADGAEGWTVQMEAQDAWAVSGPVTLVYGLGYRHSLRAIDGALIVPRVGGAVSLDRLALRMMLAYNMVEHDLPRGVAVVPSWSPPEQEVGYELDVEVPVGNGVRLGGSLVYEPVEFQPTGVEPFGEPAAVRPIYYSDGNASMRRSSFALIQDLGESTRTTLEISRGEAEGMLIVPGTAYAPVLLLARRQLEFSSGQLGVRILPSGTDLQLEYRRVRERPLSEKLGDSGARQEALEVRLTQDLLRLRTMGDWRLLMGLRLASLEEGNGQGESAEEPLAYYTDARGHGVSAGLSVTF